MSVWNQGSLSLYLSLLFSSPLISHSDIPNIIYMVVQELVCVFLSVCLSLCLCMCEDSHIWNTIKPHTIETAISPPSWDRNWWMPRHRCPTPPQSFLVSSWTSSPGSCSCPHYPSRSSSEGSPGLCRQVACPQGQSPWAVRIVVKKPGNHPVCSKQKDQHKTGFAGSPPENESCSTTVSKN